MEQSMLCQQCGSVLSAVTFTCVRGEHCKPTQLKTTFEMFPGYIAEKLPETPDPEIDMRVWNLEGWGEVGAANLQMGWTSNPNFKHYTQLAIGESADGHVKGSNRAERITRIR